MKYRIILGLAVFVIMIAIYSCEKNVGYIAGASSGNPAPPPPACDTSNLTYSTGAGVIQPIINSQCATSTACHGAGAPKANGDFSSYALIQLHASGGTSSPMYTNLVGPTSTPMPNVAQPGWDACDKAKLVQWLTIGAPQ
ncbi:MAG TPA: hypothetical protein VK806_04965 [Bacteroidia bacterium]|jgi:hypothetical protein|nr:hypothetical protein [Bacteroidia bacterium]